MGQTEILDWLRERRVQGDNRFFSRKDISKAMDARGVGIYKVNVQLNKLYVYKYLEIKLDTVWNRRYRLKAQYVSEGGF